MNEVRLVFIHGFMGSALNWGSTRSFIEAKGSHIKTFAVDLLGHALNHSKAPYTSAHNALAKDLESQISPFRPTHVVAHSFGLRPALMLGALKTGIIPHLIVEDSSPELSKSGYDFLTGILNAPTPFRTREDAKLYFENLFGTQSTLARFLLSNIRSNPDGLADWRFDTPFLRALLNESLSHNLWSEWENFPGKTSLIYGSRSDSMPSAIIKKMTSLRPSLDIHPIEDAGHWVHSDKPHAFVEALSNILSK